MINPYKLYLRVLAQPCWSLTQRQSIQLEQSLQSMEEFIQVGVQGTHAGSIHTYGFFDNFVPLNLLNFWKILQKM